MTPASLSDRDAPAGAARRAGAGSWAREAAAVLAGAGLLLAVVAADGRPVVFADANIYYWMGQLQVRGFGYALAPILGGPSSAAQDPDSDEADPDDMRLRRTEMAARSAWYGLVFYLTTKAGGLWAYATLEAVAASCAVRALWRAAFADRTLSHLAVMALLAIGTTLPFFAGFAMPDLWAGLGLAALGALVFLPQTLGRVSQAGLVLLVLAALTFHQSNAIAALPAIAVAAVAARALWRVPWREMAPGLCLFVVALAGAVSLQAGYVAAVKAATGDTLRSPPFLAARILADGPGRTYLRASCAKGADWALCRFKDLPLDDSQKILWSGDPRQGVFGRADADERIRIDRQQLRFVAGAIAADPLGAAGAALRDFWRTLTTVYLEDPLRDPHFYLTDPDWKDSSISDLVHQLGPCGRDETGCRPRFDPAPLAIWHGGVCLASLAFLGWAASRRETRRRVFDSGLGPLTLFLLLAYVFNAAATGILSGPFARYQARIAWLPPFAALLAARALFLRRPLSPGRPLEAQGSRSARL
jgi:hypothetical protein